MILFMFSHNTIGHIVSNEIGNQFVNYGNFNSFENLNMLKLCSNENITQQFEYSIYFLFYVLL